MNSGWCDLRFSFFEGCAKFELRVIGKVMRFEVRSDFEVDAVME